MILTILGAAGVRTPLIYREILRRYKHLLISELRLMDIDEKHLSLIRAVIEADQGGKPTSFQTIYTTDARQALKDADYVITTYRVGQAESRVIDEKVAISAGCIGQETTGAGGFAMGLRTIPVLSDYVSIMKDVCPEAWLINFANPSGMLTEAIRNYLNFPRAVGICDGPSSMLQYIAHHMHVPPNLIHGRYFGLNHLGWFASIEFMGKDIQPDLIRGLAKDPESSPLSISPAVILQLGMLPNEYLSYYYQRAELVEKQRMAAQTRGEEVLRMNAAFFTETDRLLTADDRKSIPAAYTRYTRSRNQAHQRGDVSQNGEMDNGYAELALDLLEALENNQKASLILNVPNQGAIPGMEPADIVEVSTMVKSGTLNPERLENIPRHSLALMQQIKSFEKLTIEAALEKSYDKAVFALTTHPLVGDHQLARRILDGYIQQHGSYFPALR
jgi:6-phospho-beta-glucosidase